MNRVDDRTAELKQVNRGRIRDARIRDKTKLSRPLNLIFGEFKHLMEDPYETRDIVSEARQAAHSIDAENGGEEARKGLFYQIGTSVVLTAIDGKHPLKTAGGEEIVYLVLKDKRQILLSKSYVDRVGYDEAIGKLEIENDIEASGYEPLIYGDERWSLVLAKLASTL